MVDLLERRVWDSAFYSLGWSRGDSATAVHEPATGEELGQVRMASREDVRAAAEAAGAAQPEWGKQRYDVRGAVLRGAAAAMDSHREEILRWLIRESGSTRAKADFEFALARSELLGAAAMLFEPDGVTLPSSVPGQTSVARRVPLGVVGVIAPWNYPLILSMRSVAPALALGNAVILKPATDTPVCSGFTIARIFEEAGLPEGVLHVLPGKGSEAGSALAEDGRIDMVSFTGSTSVGSTIGEAAGRTLKRVALELGGNNPHIVLPDADAKAAAAGGAFGQFFHQGQTCMAIGRHLVAESLADAYVEELVRKAEGLRVGDPYQDPKADFGPIINQSQIDSMDEIVQDAVAAGAGLRTGGRGEGLFYRPTVLTDVNPAMRAFSEEIFGPVAVVTTYRDEQEAVELANRTEHGLTSGVHSRDPQHALAVGQQLDVNMVHVNDQSVNDEVVAPFGGRRASGNGTSFGTTSNWEEFTQWHWTTVQETPLTYPI